MSAVAVAAVGAASDSSTQPPPAAEAFEAVTYQGRPLVAALRDLQAQGLAIVFTSELVRPSMRVLEEPSSREPRLILEELLAPHGLGVREGPGGVLMVVAVSGEREGRSVIGGEVVERGSGRALSGAVVAVLELDLDTEVDEDGRFTLAAFEAGDYTLEARAPGYLEEQLHVSLEAGALRQVSFRLHPQPFLEEEIVVRPSRLALLSEGPDSTVSLGREEIGNLPHLGGDVFRAASLLPGTASNDVSAAFSVRGGRPDEVKILLDGQELYQAYHLQDYDNALSLVPAHTLSEATLTTGAFPASQGDRMSGVFDLRTVEPPSGLHVRLGLSVFSAEAGGSGRFAADRGAWLASTRRGTVGLGDRIVDEDEDPSFWDLLAKAEVRTRLGTFSGRMLTAEDELEVTKADEEGFERLENDYRSSYGWLMLQSTVGRQSFGETIASWSQIRRHRGGVGSDEEGGFALSDERDLEIWSLSQTWAAEPASSHLLEWGWELRHYDVAFDYLKDLDRKVRILPAFGTASPAAHTFADDLAGDQLALWGSDRVRLSQRLTAELGLRYDRHPDTEDTLLSPRLNLARRIGERSVVRAGWGRFFQSQRPYELQVEDGERNLHEAELSRQWVIGFETLFPPGGFGIDALRAEMYWRRIDDPRPRYENLLEPLNVFPEIEPDRVGVAPRRGTARGLELLLRGSSGVRFDWWLSYVYSRAEERVEGFEVPRSLDQPQALRLDLNFRLPKSWNLNLAWRYHTGWPTTPVEEQLVAVPGEDEEEPSLIALFGPLRSERLPAYHRLDLRASRSWSLGRGRLSLFIDVQNLYDRRNLGGFDLGLDSDTGLVELEGESWPGIFPSLGLTWEL